MTTIYRTSRTNLGHMDAMLDPKRDGLLIFRSQLNGNGFSSAGRTKVSRAFHSLSRWCVPVNAQAAAELPGIEAQLDAIQTQIETLRAQQEALVEQADLRLRSATNEDFFGPKEAKAIPRSWKLR